MAVLRRWRWIGLLGANVVLLMALGAREMTRAAPPEPERRAFDDAIVQRQEMIGQLKELIALVKEQNTLLKSGKLRVTIEQPK